MRGDLFLLSAAPAKKSTRAKFFLSRPNYYIVRDSIMLLWHDKLGEIWVEEEDGVITIDYQLNGIKRTPFDFYVHVHPNGRITGRGSRINKDVIQEILQLYRR